MNRKDLCNVYAGEGNIKGRSGLFRIIVLAPNKEAARDALRTTDHIMQFYHISKSAQEWALYDESTSIGDVFATHYDAFLSAERPRYEEVDPEDVEA